MCETVNAVCLHIGEILHLLAGCTLQAVPGGLPSRYQKALSQRYKSIESWQQFVAEAGLTKEQRRTFGAVVEARFQVNMVTVLACSAVSQKLFLRVIKLSRSIFIDSVVRECH